MRISIPRLPRRALRAALAAGAVSLLASSTFAISGARQSPSQQSSSQQSRETAGQILRVPRQQAQNTAALDGIVRDAGFSNVTIPVPGAILTLRNLQTGQTISAVANGEGIFRIFPILPGHYDLRVTSQDYGPFAIASLAFR